MSETAVDFQRIHDSYRSRILRYLTRLVGEHEAEDLAQNVFVKVSEGLKNLSRRSLAIHLDLSNRHQRRAR